MMRLILVALLVVGCGAAAPATPPVTPSPTATVAPTASLTPAEAALQHIVDAIDRLGAVSVSGDEAIREWTSAEIEWVTSNPTIPDNVQVAYITLLTELVTAESNGEDLAEAVARVRNSRSVFADLLPPD